MRSCPNGFSYYRTVGSNRDEFVIGRKMKKIDWLDTPASRSRNPKVEAADESSCANGKVLNSTNASGCHNCSVTCKKRWTTPRRR